MTLVWKENPQLAWELLRIIDKELEIEKPLPHVTELIYCLTKGYWDRTSPIGREPKTTCLFAIGVGLGEVLLKTLRTEVAGGLDGIYSSVDLLMPDGRMGELKTTRYSVNKQPQDWSAGWHKQLLAYMKVRGTTEAVYAVMYVIPAEFKVWEVTATQEDVDNNWTWLQARKVQYMVHMDAKPEPTMPRPFTYNEKWECKGCQYLTLCEAEAATIKQEEELANLAAMGGKDEYGSLSQE